MKTGERQPGQEGAEVKSVPRGLSADWDGVEDEAAACDGVWSTKTEVGLLALARPRRYPSSSGIGGLGGSNKPSR